MKRYDSIKKGLKKNQIECELKNRVEIKNSMEDKIAGKKCSND